MIILEEHHIGDFFNYIFEEHVLLGTLVNIFGQYIAQLLDNILHIQMAASGQQHIGQFVGNNIESSISVKILMFV